MGMLACSMCDERIYDGGDGIGFYVCQRCKTLGPPPKPKVEVCCKCGRDFHINKMFRDGNGYLRCLECHWPRAQHIEKAAREVVEAAAVWWDVIPCYQPMQILRSVRRMVTNIMVLAQTLGEE